MLRCLKSDIYRQKLSQRKILHLWSDSWRQQKWKFIVNWMWTELVTGQNRLSADLTPYLITGASWRNGDSPTVLELTLKAGLGGLKTCFWWQWWKCNPTVISGEHCCALLLLLLKELFHSVIIFRSFACHGITNGDVLYFYCLFYTGRRLNKMAKVADWWRGCLSLEPFLPLLARSRSRVVSFTSYSHHWWVVMVFSSADSTVLSIQVFFHGNVGLHP